MGWQYHYAANQEEIFTDMFHVSWFMVQILEPKYGSSFVSENETS